jgi:membrane protein YdbS with pleckstrin-like domain
MRSRLRPGEELVVVVHRHPIALAGPMATGLFAAGACVAAFLAPAHAWRYVGGVALVAAGCWGLWRWLLWSRDLWAVTSQRVIDESGVLTVRLVDSPLETINNVACQQTLFGRMLGFGRVDIFTAAERGPVTIDGIAQPESLRDAILDMKERRRAGTPQAPRST